MSEVIEFGADKVKVNGPLTGGEYSITFYTGEYEREKAAELLKVPQETFLRVSVRVEK